MPTRHPRLDHYGAPLPELSEASRQSLADTPANLTQRRHIQAVLDETYKVLLRRDMHADVTVSFTVVAGRIQQHVRVGVVRQYRCAEEE